MIPKIKTLCLHLSFVLLAIHESPADGDDVHRNGALFPWQMASAAHHDEERWGYVDAEGHVRIRPQYKYATPFSEGLAFVMPFDNSKWGVIHEDGSWAVPPSVEVLSGTPYPYSEGMSQLFKDRRFGYLDVSGSIKIAPIYESASPFSDGLAVVKLDGHTRYIDRDGATIFPDQFDEVRPFREGLAVVKLGGKYGAINRQGAWVIAASYDLLKGPSEGWLVYSKDESSGLMRATGEVLPNKTGVGHRLPVDGMSVMRVGEKWGAADMSRHLEGAVAAEYDNLDDFSEGLAAFEKDGKSGYIDKSGRVAIDLGTIYEACEPFRHGLAFVRKTGSHEGYLKKDGSWAFRRKLKL